MAHSPRRRYRRALPLLSVVAGLLMAGGPVVADGGDKGGDVFAAARAAVAGRRIAKTSALGFTLEKKPFTELPAEGALLVGLDVGLRKVGNDELVFALRPLYRTAQGDTSYQNFGVFQSAAEPAAAKKRGPRKQATRTVHLQADPGYAVGAITLRTGVNIRGMSLTFMRVSGRTLDPQQSYTSDWLGDTKFGRQGTVSGNGAPIIGVFGNQDEWQVLALGLLYINDETAAAPEQPAPAGSKRTRAARSQPAAPSATERLLKMAREEEEAAARAKAEEAAPAAAPPAEAKDNPPVENAAPPAAPAPAAKDDGAEPEAPQPIVWQRWQVLGPAALAIFLVSLTYGVHRARRLQADSTQASPVVVNDYRTLLQPDSVLPVEPPPPPPRDTHKIVNGVVGFVIAGVCAVIAYQLASGKFGPQPFREFTSAEGKFRVEMPGSPTEGSVFVAGVFLTTYTLEERDGAYGVAYIDVPVIGNLSSMQITQALNGACEGMVRNVNGKFTGESAIRLNGKYPGREVRAELPVKDGLIKGRLYLVNRRVYMVMVTGLSNWVNSANAKRFLDSLEVTP
ncbi:MAG TPA: hypothetical protein VKI17_03215, partial [Gemmataceae bacterium]|nr:hypothetical protein [Gemmataceae bacterium]